MARRQTTHAAAAKIIRKQLKAHNITATVRARSYAGGSSIGVTIKQDVTPATAQKIEEYCQQFEMGHFDGMQDMYEYSNVNADLPQVKFVFVKVQYSDEIKSAAKALVDTVEGLHDWDKDSWVWQTLNGSGCLAAEFWTAHKPRVRLAA